MSPNTCHDRQWSRQQQENHQRPATLRNIMERLESIVKDKMGNNSVTVYDFLLLTHVTVSKASRILAP